MDSVDASSRTWSWFAYWFVEPSCEHTKEQDETRIMRPSQWNKQYQRTRQYRHPSTTNFPFQSCHGSCRFFSERIIWWRPIILPALLTGNRRATSWLALFHPIWAVLISGLPLMSLRICLRQVCRTNCVILPLWLDGATFARWTETKSDEIECCCCTCCSSSSCPGN